MSWPPVFQRFDLEDRRMTLLFGKNPRNRARDDTDSQGRDIELGTHRGGRLEESSGNDTDEYYKRQEGHSTQQKIAQLLSVETLIAQPAIAHLTRQQVPSLRHRPALYSSSSFTSSTTTLMPDKLGILDKPVELPEKRYSRWLRNLRWTVFNVYRRLNFLVILPNVIVMIVLGVKHNLLSLSPELITTAVAANIAASVLIRQELLINLLFTIFGNAPKWLPLRIRRLSAKIYHLGGVHSGAGIAAVVWFGLLNYAIVHIPQRTLWANARTAVWAITFSLDMLLLSILLLSEPHIRAKQHNLWEMVHRFAGWTTVGLFWALYIVLSNAQRQGISPRLTMPEILIKSPAFWLLVVITVSLIFPWLRLRRVPVHAEPLSDHAIRLHFTHTNAPLCSAPRMSDNPLKEWHAFAAIPEEDGSGFSVIVSRAGDWTGNIIRNPPTRMWVRGIPTRGVLHVAKIFRKLVLVATGSGIGPVLSLLYARNLDCRILWSTPDPERTYGKSIMEHVRHGDSDAIIINTTESGRPNLVQYAHELYKSLEAEAVFIISNPKVTRKFVYALESRGVPTFAPIFDS